MYVMPENIFFMNPMVLLIMTQSSGVKTHAKYVQSVTLAYQSSYNFTGKHLLRITGEK